LSKSLTIVGIAGSLRKESYNKHLLKAAGKLLLNDIQFIIADISSVPLYNQDLEDDFPETVINLKRTVVAANALIFSTPEYNGSIPGVLENVIDWLSRLSGQSSLSGKPVRIIG
jgi:chromate reductase